MATVNLNNGIINTIGNGTSVISSFIGDVMEVTPLTSSIKQYAKVAVRVGMYVPNTAVALDSKLTEYNWWSESREGTLYENAVDLSQKDLKKALDWVTEEFVIDEEATK